MLNVQFWTNNIKLNHLWSTCLLSCNARRNKFQLFPPISATSISITCFFLFSSFALALHILIRSADCLTFIRNDWCGCGKFTNSGHRKNMLIFSNFNVSRARVLQFRFVPHFLWIFFICSFATHLFQSPFYSSFKQHVQCSPAHV